MCQVIKVIDIGPIYISTLSSLSCHFRHILQTTLNDTARLNLIFNIYSYIRHMLIFAQITS